MSAYNDIQQNVTDLTAQLKKAQDGLTALQSDPALISAQGIIQQVGASTTLWVDSKGVKFNSPSDNSYWRQKVNEWRNTIDQSAKNVTDLKASLSSATANLAAYEKNSPIGALAVQTTTAIQTNKTKIIVVSSIAVLLLILTFAIVKIIKTEKAKAA